MMSFLKDFQEVFLRFNNFFPVLLHRTVSFLYQGFLSGVRPG